MKSLFKIGVLSSLLCFTALYGCMQSELISTDVKGVEKLISPSDGVDIPLQSSATASVFFEWEEVVLPDGSLVMYEVVFTTPDGDLSSPLYTVPSDNKGLYPYLSLSHKQLNKIGAAVGLDTGEKGELKWTVIASKGVGEKICGESRTMTITRLNGFTDIPESVVIYGEGTEYGDVPSAAVQLKSDVEGEFEIFTSLIAGQSIRFLSRDRNFYVEGQVLKEGEGDSEVSESGVYKVSLDFNSGIAVFARISALKFWHCNSAVKNLEIPYIGNSLWGLYRHVMTEADFGENVGNPRYRFEMEYADGTSTFWGPLNKSEDGFPNGSESYYYAAEYTLADGVDDFNPKWKRTQKNGISWVGYVYNITLDLDPNAIYTHTLEETVADEDPSTDTWPENAPAEFYVAGAAAEHAEGIVMKALGEGKFELFTRLESGKDFNFADGTTSSAAIYSISAEGELVQNGTTSVTEDGVYKVAVDFGAKKATLSKITDLRWYHCNSATKNVVLNYVGDGVWKVSRHTMTDEDIPGSESDQKNPRYRFEMTYADGTVTYWGPSEIKLDSAPTGADSYYYALEYTRDELLANYSEAQIQFNPKWKKAESGTWIDTVYDFTLVTKGDAPYTHTIVKGDPEDVIPEKVYVTGEGTEGGTVLSDAIQMKSLGEGKFEVFTWLESGRSICFADSNSGTPSTFSISADAIVKGGTCTVDSTCVYKIVMDFSTKIAVMSKIKDVRWFHCNCNAANLELSYVGNGVWSILDHEIAEEDMPDGGANDKKNPRYRFLMTYADGTVTYWGPTDISLDSLPTGEDSYFYAKEYTREDILAKYGEAQLQFNPKWKRSQGNSISWIGFKYDMRLILQADGDYRHELIEK